MALQLQIDNYGSVNIFRRDTVQTTIAPGANAVTVENTTGYPNGQMVILGPLGTNGSELQTIGSCPDATTINLAGTTKLQHNQLEEVTLINADQINVYRAPDTNGICPPDAAFAVIATVNISIDDEFSYYTDNAGSSAYWYKFTYINSVTGVESSLIDSTANRGGGYGYYCSVDKIRRAAGLQNNPYITDADIDEKRKIAQSLVDGGLQGQYAVPFQIPVDPVIMNITRLFAAGLLLNDDYGPQDGPMSAEGESKMTQAQAMLDLLDSRKFKIVDSAGNDLTLATAVASKSWPNSTSHTVPGYMGGSKRYFRMSHVDDSYYGGERRY